MELGAVIISIVLILFGWWYIRRNKFMKHMERYPGPPPLPIVGNALDLASPTAITTPAKHLYNYNNYCHWFPFDTIKVEYFKLTIYDDIIPRCLEYYKKYGGIVKLYIGPTPTMLLITDYNLIEYILSSTTIVSKAQQYEYFSNWLGNGLLTARGDDRWRKHRKIITPTFHFKILEQFIDIFESASKVLVKKLHKELDNSSIDICPLIGLCTLDVICESAMGTPVNAQENLESKYALSVQEICRIIEQRTFNPILQYKIPYYFSEQYRTEKKSIEFINSYADLVIKNREAELKNKHNNMGPDNVLGVKRRLTFLDLLLQENTINKIFTYQDIKDEVNTFMFGGHHTTASGISFVLYCLAENQDIQEKVMEELHMVRDRAQSVTIRDLQEMKYLETVIKEALRLYPPVPLFSRNTDEDIEYEGGILPKGITLIINAYGLHRNPEMYPEPEKFIPERFTNENSVGRPPYSYIPFSAGPRNCIGQKYAMLEMKTVLSTILRHYKVLPATPKHTLALSEELVLMSSSGICISLEERSL